MDTTSWNIEYKKISDLIEGKIKFLEDQEKKIDPQKSDAYNQAILSRIKKEREFINALIEFLLNTENTIGDLVTSNKHLKFQNTLNFLRAEISEKEMLNKFETSIRDELGIGAER